MASTVAKNPGTGIVAVQYPAVCRCNIKPSEIAFEDIAVFFFEGHLIRKFFSDDPCLLAHSPAEDEHPAGDGQGGEHQARKNVAWLSEN